MIDWSGVGRYTQNLLKGLAAIDKENEYILFCHAQSQNLAPETPNFVKTIITQPVFSMSSQLSWAREVNQADLDIFHSPYFVLPLLFAPNSVVTIHDLIPLLFPGNLKSKAAQMYYTTMIKLTTKKAERIIAVSDRTKEDLIKHLGISAGKITVIPEAADERYHPLDVKEKDFRTVLKKYASHQFLLYVGNYKPHKNLIRLVEAFHEALPDLPKGAQLVIIGPRDKRYPEASRLVKKLGLEKSVILAGYVSEEELLILYNSATAFIFPSLYEGFGLPPLEAMASGLPVISSNLSSLPEVVGNAALPINPEDVDDIGQAIVRVFSDEDLRRDLRKKGLARAKKFSWQKTAEMTLEVYEGVARKGERAVSNRQTE
jgi:glycosyltransferase involved in cell wall biosynthesis